MRSIAAVFSAFSNLAASINALAGVLDVATGKLRQQLALDETPLSLPHAEVIDAEANPATDSGSTSTKRRKAS